MSKDFDIQNQQGFSLVEILVATTILAFMMAGLYTMVDQSSKTSASVTKEDRDFLIGHVAINKIEEDLSQIYSSLYYAARKRPHPDENRDLEDNNNVSPLFPFNTIVDVPAPQIDAQDKSTIVFFNAGNRRKYENQKQSKFQWVRYSIRSREKGEDENPNIRSGDFELIRQVINESIYKPDLDWDAQRAQVMLTNVSEFTIEYWDPKRRKFVDSLRELDVDDRLAPRGFKVKIVWFDRSGIEHRSFKVVRPLWPKFDTLKDEVERRPKKVENLNNVNNEGPRFNPVEDEGDFE
ncbi:MAG: hypothetical protein Fur0010_27850 [Bdellovibrio sp.]